MSLLQADLPSEDEADDDYNPAKDDRDDATAQAKAKQTNAKRRRGSAAYTEASADVADALQLNEDTDEVATPTDAAKKSKADRLWTQLNKGRPPKASAIGTKKESASVTPGLTAQPAAGSKVVNLAAFCRPVPKKQKLDSDAVSTLLCWPRACLPACLLACLPACLLACLCILHLAGPSVL